MSDDLGHLLRAIDVPDPQRAEELWAEYRTGGPGADDAVRTLLAWYGKDIYRRIWGQVRSDAAEDVFQEVLERLHRHSRRLLTWADAHRWLRCVADAASCDYLRRETRRRRREARRAVSAADATPPDGHPDLREAIAAALSKLSPKHRRAIALLVFEGLTVEEAAKAEGVHRDTLATWRDAGFARLRELLPAGAVGVGAGTAGVEAALAAGRPVMTSERLGVLAGEVWKRAVPYGPTLGKGAVVLLVGLTLGGFGLAGWAATREPEPQVPPPAAERVPVPEETVPERNLRVFHAEVLPVQLDRLKTIALGGGEAELEGVRSYDTRLECTYRIRHHVLGTAGSVTRLWFIHNAVDGGTGVNLDLHGRGEWRPLDTRRPIILWRNPLTKAEVVVPVPALEDARQAFDRLPNDDRTAAEARTHVGRVRRAVEPLLGVTWFGQGDPALRAVIALTPEGWLIGESSGGGKDAKPLAVMQVGPDGRVVGLPFSPGPGRVSSDGRRVEFAESGCWWQREPTAQPK